MFVVFLLCQSNLQIRQLSLKFVSAAKRDRNTRIKFVFFFKEIHYCDIQIRQVLYGPLYLGDDFECNFDESEYH